MQTPVTMPEDEKASEVTLEKALNGFVLKARIELVGVTVLRTEVYTDFEKALGRIGVLMR